MHKIFSNIKSSNIYYLLNVEKLRSAEATLMGKVAIIDKINLMFGKITFGHASKASIALFGIFSNCLTFLSLS